MSKPKAPYKEHAEELIQLGKRIIAAVEKLEEFVEDANE